MENEPRAPVEESCIATPELTEFLLTLGATPEQITGADPATLVGLGADLVFAAPEGLSAREVATRAGTSADVVLDIWRALGVEVPGPDTAMFAADDVDLVRTLTSVDLFTASEGD